MLNSTVWIQVVFNQSLPIETCSFSRVGRECSSEHGPLAYRLFFGRFILDHILVLD
jgi:hypothetical protein